MDSCQNLNDNLIKRSYRLALSDDYIGFIEFILDQLLALNLGMVKGQVVPNEKQGEVRASLQRYLKGTFLELVKLDGEKAIHCLSGIHSERKKVIDGLEQLNEIGVSSIDYYYEIPEAESKVTSKILALKDLGPRILDVESIYPLSEPRFGSGHSINTIERFQNEMGLELPVEYRDFANRCGRIEALDFYPNYCLASIFQIEGLFLETAIKEYCMSEGYLPIGTDCGGTLYVCEIREYGAVYIWDQFSPVDRGEPVAENFCMFLDRIADDWMYFLQIPK
jgi:hypothetical protein